MLLKYAQSTDGVMGKHGRQVLISNPLSARVVHKMRAEYDAFLVGTNTALTDNPQLTNRLWYGRSPLRIVFDKKIRIPGEHYLMDDTVPTWVVTEKQNKPEGKQFSNTRFVGLPFDEQLLPALLGLLYENNISSLVVEGGANTLDHFLSEGLWDEAWVITGERLLTEGITPPRIHGQIIERTKTGTDALTIYRKRKDGS